jgi:hypothetical protein
MNSLVVTSEERREMKENEAVEQPVEPRPVRIVNPTGRRPRRSAVSPYLR